MSGAIAAALLLVALASCGVSTTTVTPVSDGVSSSTVDQEQGEQNEPSEPQVVECPFFPSALDADLEESMGSVLSGAVLDATTSDTCARRFVSGGEWVQVTFRMADESLVLFGDDTLLTNGVDTSRAERADGTLVDIVATASSPQAISTWDASLAGVFVLAGN